MGVSGGYFDERNRCRFDNRVQRTVAMTACQRSVHVSFLQDTVAFMHPSSGSSLACKSAIPTYSTTRHTLETIMAAGPGNADPETDGQRTAGKGGDIADLGLIPRNTAREVLAGIVHPFVLLILQSAGMGPMNYARRILCREWTSCCVGNARRRAFVRPRVGEGLSASPARTSAPCGRWV